MFEGTEFYETVRILQRSLQAASFRHIVHSDNIANVDTPHYKRQFVRFEEYLDEYLHPNPPKVILKRTHPKHLTNWQPMPFDKVTPKLDVEIDTNSRNDENNVDIDVEMVELTKNHLKYNAMAQMLATRFRMVSEVITTGGR